MGSRRGRLVSTLGNYPSPRPHFGNFCGPCHDINTSKALFNFAKETPPVPSPTAIAAAGQGPPDMLVVIKCRVTLVVGYATSLTHSRSLEFSAATNPQPSPLHRRTAQCPLSVCPPCRARGSSYSEMKLNLPWDWEGSGSATTAGTGARRGRTRTTYPSGSNWWLLFVMVGFSPTRGNSARPPVVVETVKSEQRVPL